MRRRARGEEGVTLTLALAFLLLFSLVIAAILVQAGTNFQTTKVVTAKGAKLYAADGGIDWGIQKVRDTATLCPDTATGQQDVGDLTLNGRAVHVTCKTLSGDNGAGGLGGGGTFGQSGWTTVATGWGTAVWSGTKARCNSASTPNDLGSTIQIVACSGAGSTPRTITDGQITTITGPNGDKLNSPSQAQFVTADVGATLSGPGIPAGTTIKKVNSLTQVQMSQKATATGSNLTVQIGGQQSVTFGGTKVFNGGGFNIASTLNGIVQGSITQYNAAPNNYCTRDQTNAHYPTPNDKSPKVGVAWLCTSSQATAVPDPQPHVVVPPNSASHAVVATFANHSKNLTAVSGTFSSTTDVSATVTGTGIPNNTTIASVTDSTHAVLSANTSAASAPAGNTLTITQSGVVHAKVTTSCAGQNVNYLYPGRYIGTAPQWGGNTYFASGVYYIEDTGETALSGNLNIGGEPGPNDPRFVDLGAQASCYTDAAADAACGGCMPADPGKGVTFIIGGTTLLDIHGGLNEMFTRIPGTMDAGATQGTTIFAMADAAGLNLVSGGSYKLSLTAGADRCNCAFVTDNSGQQIIFHGLTYSPYEPVDVFNNAGVNYSPFYGGLVANWIVARVDSGSQSGLFTGQFGAIGGPTLRTIVITSTASGTQPGEVSVVSKAVITVDVDTNKTTEVQTWRNQ
jgi:hypothetical protein